MTFELSEGNAVPLPASVALTRAAHHVTKCVMALVPLITHAVHDIINSAHFLMGWIKTKKGNLGLHRKNKYLRQGCLF